MEDLLAQWNSLRVIVFDFDGTLATCPYDFVQMREAVLRVAEAYGLARADFDLDTGLLELIEHGAQRLPECGFRDEAMTSLCALEYEAAAVTRLLPGVVHALEALRTSGLRLGIITRNSAAAVARIIGETVLPVECIMSREDVPHPKPHPDHATRMLAVLQSSPETALMVGDHPMDIDTGKAAGMRTAAVLTGQTDEATLRAAAPDLLFPSIVELTAMLLGQDTARHSSLIGHPGGQKK